MLAGEQAAGLDLVVRFTRAFGLSADRVLNEDPPRRYFLAAEPGAKGAKAGPRRPATRPIDPEKWLARVRALRRHAKGVTTEEEITRWKREGRP